MTILEEYPPNIAHIREYVEVPENKGTVFTYGDIIFNPHAAKLDDPILMHEAQHSLQQDEVGGADEWWRNWLTDTRFRMEQELEAYGIQYRRFCELHKNRDIRAKYLWQLAGDLASPQYGSVISLQEARKQIEIYFKK